MSGLKQSVCKLVVAGEDMLDMADTAKALGTVG